jgi:hypothetical protein
MDEWMDGGWTGKALFHWVQGTNEKTNYWILVQVLSKQKKKYPFLLPVAKKKVQELP